MKTKNEIINQDAIFLNDWKKDGMFKVIANFEDIYITKKEYESETSPYYNEFYWRENKELMKKALCKYKDVKILFGSYGYANYSGEAWVLFEKDGELYEVNGSHCSCYGLEGQWNPEEVSLLELENRLINGTFGEDDWSDNNFKEELCKFLGVEFKENLDRY